MDVLPDDVLADVLGRLPPPSLAACRCVSKGWRGFVNGRDALRLRLLPAKVAGIFLNLSVGFEFFARPTAGPAIPRILEYLPAPRHRFGRVHGHCSGLLVFPAGVVANPATRQWTRLPPPLCPEISPSLFYEHLAFDPTASRHYEVFLIPVVPPVRNYRAVFLAETAEWPPEQFSMRVFSSRTWRWGERTFLREGDSAGTVAEMRLLQEDAARQMFGLGKMHQSVYWDGALYASCAGNFFMRISMSSGKYQVIEPPIGIELDEYHVLHLGRSKKEVCCALIHERCRLQTWFLKESSGQMEWVLKHQVDFGYVLAECQYGNQIHGPWILHDDDDDFTCHVEVKSIHESQGLNDSVYSGENEDENNGHYESGEDFRCTSDDEEDECCKVPLKFEWDSDNDNIIDSRDVVKMRCNKDITFLGFHPSKEIVFVRVSSSRGVAYHLNGAKVQDLGELVFSELDYVQQSFVYTPCRMALP